MPGPLARVPRVFTLLGSAFVALLAAVALGLHAPLDRAVAAMLWQEAPCWARVLGERASVVFAAELSLLYAVGLGYVCLRARRLFAAGWIVFLLFAGVGLELILKYNFDHPAPSAFFQTLTRPLCGAPGPYYPFTVVPTPSTLPSGYTLRAAYFCLLAALMLGARWPAFRPPLVLALAAVAVMAGASRVVVGWHWPTDVLAGLLVGACAAVLAAAQADGFAWLRAGGDKAARRQPTARRSEASGGRGSASRSAARPQRRSPPRR